MSGFHTHFWIFGGICRIERIPRVLLGFDDFTESDFDPPKCIRFFDRKFGRDASWMPSKTRHCLVKVGIAPLVGYTQAGEKFRRTRSGGELKMLGGYLDVRVLRGMKEFIALKAVGSGEIGWLVSNTSILPR